jgi:hypothetical protein
MDILMKTKTDPTSMLVWIKLLHTVIWLFIASCIVAIPVAAALRRFPLAAVLAALVLVECMVLAVNRCRCPLTDLAGHFTAERMDNFDIYMPLWLARRNKQIFGTIFVLGGLFALARWLIP